MAFDKALETEDLNVILESFSDYCEIELLSIKLSGKEGASIFKWIFEHITEINFLPIIMVEGKTFFEEFKVLAKFMMERRFNQNRQLFRCLKT